MVNRQGNSTSKNDSEEDLSKVESLENGGSGGRKYGTRRITDAISGMMGDLGGEGVAPDIFRVAPAI